MSLLLTILVGLFVRPAFQIADHPIPVVRLLALPFWLGGIAALAMCGFNPRTLTTRHDVDDTFLGCMAETWWGTHVEWVNWGAR
jgi:hypothetical protein